MSTHSHASSTDDETPQPIEVVRARIHRLNDTVQAHEGSIIRHDITIQMHGKQLEHLTSTTATREQLTGAVLSVTALMDANKLLFETKLNSLSADSKAIQRALAWAIALILSGVGVAVLNLILKKPLP